MGVCWCELFTCEGTKNEVGLLPDKVVCEG